MIIYLFIPSVFFTRFVHFIVNLDNVLNTANHIIANLDSIMSHKY